MKTQLNIKIASDGSVQVKVAGIAGSSCLGATKFLEDAMGGGVAVQEPTDEYYQAEAGALVEEGA